MKNYSEWNNKTNKPIGIINKNNTCYMNSILQILLNIDPFVYFFLSEKYKEYSDNILLKLISRICDYWSRNTKKTSIYPYKFIKNCLNEFDIDLNEQCDAHEFLCNLLDFIHNECKYSVKISYKNRKTQSELIKNCKKNWELFCKDNYSIITSIFIGQMRREIVCKCKNKSISYESINGLTFNVNDKHIKNSFDNYFHNEEIEYTCQNCKVKSTRKLIKRYEILPNYLIINLNRSNMYGNKNTHQYLFSEEINLKGYCEEELTIDKETKYSLMGAVYHHGNSLNYGHYTCMVKHRDGDWYLYDDDVITKMESEVNKRVYNSVYLLVYKRN